MQKRVLLLTGTITPSAAMPNNQRSDAEIRLQDYLSALTFYIEQTGDFFDYIQFYENSGSDLSRIRAQAPLAARHGAALDAAGYTTDLDPTLGKGVGELELIDHAMDHIRATVGEDCQVWKITGRLIVKNIAKMVATAPRTFDLYCDMRSVPLIGESLGGNDWVDTRLIGFSPRWHDHCLRGFYRKSGRVMEKHLFNAVRSTPMDGYDLHPRFRAQPRFKGICGGSLKDYEGVEYQVKDAIRASMRRLAPGLWL